MSYSGGWKMKIQLCAAQPMHCGVLMRIELTGHLDVNIRWLVDWLESFTGQHAHHVRGEVPGEKGRTASLDVGNCVYVEHEFVYEEFGVQDDGFPVLSENKSHTCNAIYGYPGGPDRAANLEMPVTSYSGG